MIKSIVKLDIALSALPTMSAIFKHNHVLTDFLSCLQNELDKRVIRGGDKKGLQELVSFENDSFNLLVFLKDKSRVSLIYDKIQDMQLCLSGVSISPTTPFFVFSLQKCVFEGAGSHYANKLLSKRLGNRQGNITTIFLYFPLNESVILKMDSCIS